MHAFIATEKSIRLSRNNNKRHVWKNGFCCYKKATRAERLMTYFNKGSDGLYLLHMLEATRSREEERGVLWDELLR